ncbi:UNVERIFIED_CONTAM: hypothetical protein RMT77_018579 [Armadillidium vulgare]
MPVLKLDNPAVKLAIEDLINIKEEGGDWVYSNSNLKFKANLLWFQGTIKDISEDKNEIILQENANSVIVENCKGIPGGNEWMRKGQYIMVFGEIQEIKSMSKRVKAIKISDLSNNALHKEIWPYDVKEAKLIYGDRAKENIDL